MAQAPEAPARSRAQIAERTLRTRWWQAPRVTAARLAAWVAYAAMHVFAGHRYYVARYHYLTPFYSPYVSGERVPGSSSLGRWLGAVPPAIPYALVSLPFAPGFRLSCYYYRRACYRSFWRAPARCAVREPHAPYTGETRFPLITQNFGEHPVRYWAWTKVSLLNARHMQLAWITLGTLMPTGLYIMLVASGAVSSQGSSTRQNGLCYD